MRSSPETQEIEELIAKLHTTRNKLDLLEKKSAELSVKITEQQARLDAIQNALDASATGNVRSSGISTSQFDPKRFSD